MQKYVTHKANFSVILPAKGPCTYLIDALNSINRSTLLPTEVILIDDGIDKSVKNIITQSYGFNLQIIPNNGQGLIDALNSGIQYSNNEFLARIDSDDLVVESRFEVQFNFLLQNPSVSVVGSQVIYIDVLGQQIGLSEYPVGILNDLQEFRNRCYIAHPSVMYRKSHVIEAGGYIHIFKAGTTDLAEDFYLWRRLANVGKIVNHAEALTKYIQHENQLSNKHNTDQELATIYSAAISNLGRIRTPTVFLEKLEFRSQLKTFVQIFKGSGARKAIYFSALFILTWKMPDLNFIQGPKNQLVRILRRILS